MSRRERQRRQARHRGHPVQRVVLWGMMLTVCALLLGAAGVFGWVLSVADSSPNIDQLSPRIRGQVSEVYASNGELLGYISSDVLRTYVPQSGQPAMLRDATVAIEDRRFWHHGGVDYYGILRAGVKDVLAGGDALQGGSTLTMQLVKNVYEPDISHDYHSLKYKIVQAKLANQLEDQHSKSWILTQYLNDVSYTTVDSETAIGVGAASQLLFDKPVGMLDLAQMALLAGLPQAPSDYNPFEFPTLARYRRRAVLQAMLAAGYISRAQEQAADASPLQVHHNDVYQKVRQPYVFDYVRQQIVAKLGQAALDRGGLKIYTTINLTDQAYAKEALEENEGESGDPGAALVSTDPATGDILAMAQNTNYGTGPGETTVNYAADAERQSGSSFKTFSLMTLIHDQDGDPNQTYYVSKPLGPNWDPPLTDPPASFPVHTSEETYQGTISVTRATTVSDNTVYAQLAADLGMSNVIQTAYDMGITTHQCTNLSTSIGGLCIGVTPLEMSDAYATLADGGVHHPATILAKVVLPSGTTEQLGDPAGNRVFSGGEAYAGTQVLKTVVDGAGGTGTAASYGCPVAGKTGTTSNYTDAWFVGYSPNLSTSVWVGYPQAESESMTDVNGLGPGFGGTLAAPIWRDYMEKAEDGYCDDFTQPTTLWQGTPYFGKHSVSGHAATQFTVPGTTTTGTTTGTGTTATTQTGTTPTTQAPPTGGGATGGTKGGGTTGAGTGGNLPPAAAPGSASGGSGVN